MGCGATCSRTSTALSPRSSQSDLSSIDSVKFRRRRSGSHRRRKNVLDDDDDDDCYGEESEVQIVCCEDDTGLLVTPKHPRDRGGGTECEYPGFTPEQSRTPRAMSPDRSTNSCHTQPVGSYREMGLLTPTSAHSSSARNTHRSTGRFVPPIITVTTPGHTTRNPYLMLPAAVSHAEKMDIILQDMRQKVQRLPILTEIWQEEFVLAQKVRGSVGECLSQRSVSQDIREVLRGGPTASPLPRSRIALQTGHTIPDFSLPNQSGRYVCALDLCRQGHWVVINFFRGYWCPVCCIAQLTLEKNCNKILQYATILSVSPEIEEGCVEMRGFSFAFDVLTDYDNVVGKQFGLVYTLTPGLIDAYARAGFDLHFQYHTECNQPVELPIPAVYIASPPNGVITWAYLNEDFKKRAPVEDIVAHLEKMHP